MYGLAPADGSTRRSRGRKATHQVDGNALLDPVFGDRVFVLEHAARKDELQVTKSRVNIQTKRCGWCQGGLIEIRVEESEPHPLLVDGETFLLLADL